MHAVASFGYSGTPLARKLGITAGSVVAVIGGPPGYVALLDPLPPEVRIVTRVSEATDLTHLFVTERAALVRHLARLRTRMRPDATVWVSWPKKASKMPTTITEDVIRDVALPIGFVDVKVCAVDAVWSGLKLVLRKELR